MYTHTHIPWAHSAVEVRASIVSVHRLGDQEESKASLAGVGTLPAPVTSSQGLCRTGTSPLCTPMSAQGVVTLRGLRANPSRAQGSRRSQGGQLELVTQGLEKGERPWKGMTSMQGASHPQEETQGQRRGFSGGEARTITVPEARERVSRVTPRLTFSGKEADNVRYPARDITDPLGSCAHRAAPRAARGGKAGFGELGIFHGSSSGRLSLCLISMAPCAVSWATESFVYLFIN